MSHSTKTAFCPLYFRAHGGRFTEKGLPIFTADEEDENAPGMCGRAFDCGTCSLMVNWIPEMVGWSAGWECDGCLKETFLQDKEAKTERWLPGFYHSSQPDEQAQGFISGCTRCGWPGSFLQLVFRRPHG